MKKKQIVTSGFYMTAMVDSDTFTADSDPFLDSRNIEQETGYTYYRFRWKISERVFLFCLLMGRKS